MGQSTEIVVVVGSAPDATLVATLPVGNICLVSVNNAYRLANFFDFNCFSGDFPGRSDGLAEQVKNFISEDEYIVAINAYGGLIMCGATMSLASAYWAIHALRPKVLAFLGCDMIYGTGQTHFYGRGEPDPLRIDPTLRDLDAKSCRQLAIAALQGTHIVNLSLLPESRLAAMRLDASKLGDAGALLSEAERALADWSEAGQHALGILECERNAPFDPEMTDYMHLMQDEEALRFIDDIDRRWREWGSRFAG
jgi:hypothetical protein